MSNTELSNKPLTKEDVFNGAQKLLIKAETDKSLSKEERERLMNKAENVFNELLNDEKVNYHIAFVLAAIQIKKGNHGHALILIQEALRLHPEFIDAINNLGYTYKLLGMVKESRETFERLIKLTEDKPEIKEKISNADLANHQLNLGSTYIAQGTAAESIPYFTRAIELNPDLNEAHWNRALANLEIGNYAEGWDEYDYGDRVTGTTARRYGAETTPYWDGTPGQTIAIYGEQGIGDELMFMSMLPDVMKDCKVIVDAHPRLADMYRQSFPNVPIYGTRKVATPKPFSLPWTEFHRIDAKVSIATLAKHYRRSKEDFPGTPYLKANPELIEKYREKLASMGPRKKIGISWRGGVQTTNKNVRRIALDALLPILSLDADFISLQYDKGIGNKVKKFEDANGIKLNHWQDMLDDYDETAALVTNLDLIISVPQSVVHLAGSLGVPTIQLCPKQALWQMGPYGENMPWYSCVENIWQDEAGEWSPVIEKAKEKLCSLLQTNTAS